jgi:spectinomycin phosphotransferase
MLEKPDIPDELILSGVRDQYRFRPTKLTFLPLGYDVNTAVYRLATADERTYFLKLRDGPFDPTGVHVPQLLKDQGVQAIIAPLLTIKNQPYGSLGDFKLILYPFIEGQDGYRKALSDQQWLDFGSSLRGVHSVQMPRELKSLITQEIYSPHWREKVKEFQAQVEKTNYQEPVAQKLASFMREKRDEIRKVVERAEALCRKLRLQSPERVLCHADIHPGNLLISPDGRIYIVDWDNPILAPKERDLALIGGCAAWGSPRFEALFYQGYGAAEVNLTALAYYRYERIVQDLAEFDQQLLMTEEGGEDREQSFQYFASCFLPGHEIELADRVFIAGGQSPAR